jgi:hypothetical protein
MYDVPSNCCPEVNKIHVFNKGFEREKNLNAYRGPTQPKTGVGANSHGRSPEKAQKKHYFR